jgi:hypothetical protein
MNVIGDNRSYLIKPLKLAVGKLVTPLLWIIAGATVSVIAVLMALALLTSIILCLPIVLYIFLRGLYRDEPNKLNREHTDDANTY